MKTVEVSGESFWVLIQGHLNGTRILSVDFDRFKCTIIVGTHACVFSIS